MVRYYATKLPVPLVNVVTTDHCFNLECRHCFSASHHLRLVDESAKSVRLVPRVYARPSRNSLIVGVAYLSGAFAKLFQGEFFTNRNSQIFRPAKDKRYTVEVTCDIPVTIPLLLSLPPPCHSSLHFHLECLLL